MILMPPPKVLYQQELLYNRLVKRQKHLGKWARRIDTDCYRLYDRDIPEIPLLIDIYGDAVSGALYKRPYEKDEGEEALWLDAMKDAVSGALGINKERIFLKTRQRQRGKAQYSKLDQGHFWKDVHEGPLVFRVNLSDYLDTGLFLDARKKRALVFEAAKGKRVLNLFSYTSTLSVSAAAGGALLVDSVDMSKTYLDWSAVNFSLNGLAHYISSSAKDNKPYRLIRADALVFLEQAKARWDLIILDPPSFSNSKKMETHLDIREGYRDLVKKCMALLNPGGRLLFSVNAKNFQFDAELFPGLKIAEIDLADEDFRNRKTPVCWDISRLS